VADKHDQARKANEAAHNDEDDEDEDTESDSDSDLGIVDGTNSNEAQTGGDERADFDGTNGENKTRAHQSKNPIASAKKYNEDKKDLHRKQRGLMQWKPMRNLAFAKDEAKFAVRRTMKKGSLSGRSPDVETETAS
jgi:hypothetical protein